MDFEESEEEKAFRVEVRAWLDALPKTSTDKTDYQQLKGLA